MASVQLTKLQATLLAAAASREAGGILPVSEELPTGDKTTTKALIQLLKRGLIAETLCKELSEAWRTEGDQHYGLVITTSGRAAIGVPDSPAPVPIDLDPPKLQPTCTGFTGSPPPLTKTKIVVDLMEREQGATIGELIAATGWLPHTTRAALTGLRKKGHVIVKSKRDDATCYTIDATGS